jgi:hypothetical protein
MWKIILIILGVIFLVAILAVAIGRITFKEQTNNEIAEMFANRQQTSSEIITEADLVDLPEPVQRYLRRVGVVGKEKIQTVRLKQTGQIRLSPGQPWYPITAEEYYTVDPPAFVWYANMQLAPGITVAGRDMYRQGQGHMLMKPLSLFAVVDAQGDEMDQGAFMRYFNEIMWFPTAYLSDYIEWKSIDDRSARATMTVDGQSISAVLHFDEQDQLVNFVADRYRTQPDGTYQMETWSTPIYDYREFHGIHIPTKGSGIWNLASGDFEYVKLEIIEIEYNNPSIY